MFDSFDFGTKKCLLHQEEVRAEVWLDSSITDPAWQGPKTTQNKIQQQRQINLKFEYMESVKAVCQIAGKSVPVVIHSYRAHIKDEKALRTRTGLGRIPSNKIVAKSQLVVDAGYTCEERRCLCSQVDHTGVLAASSSLLSFKDLRSPVKPPSSRVS